eukprot:2893463-Pyramimonas_sp.AAC.1
MDTLIGPKSSSARAVISSVTPVPSKTASSSAARWPALNGIMTDASSQMAPLPKELAPDVGIEARLRVDELSQGALQVVEGVGVVAKVAHQLHGQLHRRDVLREVVRRHRLALGCQARDAVLRPGNVLLQGRAGERLGRGNSGAPVLWRLQAALAVTKLRPRRVGHGRCDSSLRLVPLRAGRLRCR